MTPINQASLQDLMQWRQITDLWVKCACSIETDDAIDPCWFYGTFFELSLSAAVPLKETSLVEFLRSHFPDFELVLSSEGEIMEVDCVLVYSLLLYFSCLLHPIPRLQDVCKQFASHEQRIVKCFLECFLTTDKINRWFVGSAIGAAVRSSAPNMQYQAKEDEMGSHWHEVLHKIKDLNQQLETARSENASLSKENDYIRSRSVTMKELEKQNQWLRKRHKDAEEECMVLHNEIAACKDALVKTKSDLHDLRKRCSVQQVDLAEKTQKCSALSDTVANMHEKLEHTEGILAELNVAHQEVLCKLAQSDQSTDSVVQALTKALRELQTSYDQCHYNSEVLSAKLYMERVKNEKIRKEIATIREQCDLEKREARKVHGENMDKIKERMKLLQEQLALEERKNENVPQQTCLCKYDSSVEEINKENPPKQICPPAANIKQENEEPELFTAQYLEDLQNGKCRLPNGSQVPNSELMERNSKVLPHLRTNYTALYSECEIDSIDTPPSIGKQRNNSPDQYKEAAKEKNVKLVGTSSVATSSLKSKPLGSGSKAGATKTSGTQKLLVNSSSLLSILSQHNEDTPTVANIVDSRNSHPMRNMTVNVLREAITMVLNNRQQNSGDSTDRPQTPVPRCTSSSQSTGTKKQNRKRSILFDANRRLEDVPSVSRRQPRQ